MFITQNKDGEIEQDYTQTSTTAATITYGTEQPHCDYVNFTNSVDEYLKTLLTGKVDTLTESEILGAYHTAVALANLRKKFLDAGPTIKDFVKALNDVETVDVIADYLHV